MERELPGIRDSINMNALIDEESTDSYLAVISKVNGVNHMQIQKNEFKDIDIIIPRACLQKIEPFNFKNF